MFKKVAIVGVGLIGGSMALALKNKGLAKKVVGVSRRPKTLLLAKKSGAIDAGSQDLAIVKGADLLILATPVNTILKLAPRIKKFIPPRCIVTDVGSTKEEIVAKLEKIFPLYVGSHPLAGSERRGVINAHPDIFKDSLCIVTPTPNSKSAALAKITKLWAGLGVKVVILGPQAHDKILSFISHLPHVAAFSLIGCVSPKYLGLASAGLKDTTRIAASDSGLWSDIFLSNRKNILEAIEVFELNIARIKRAIQRKDRKSLLRILKRAKQKRDSLAS